MLSEFAGSGADTLDVPPIARLLALVILVGAIALLSLGAFEAVVGRPSAVGRTAFMSRARLRGSMWVLTGLTLAIIGSQPFLSIARPARTWLLALAVVSSLAAMAVGLVMVVSFLRSIGSSAPRDLPQPRIGEAVDTRADREA